VPLFNSGIHYLNLAFDNQEHAVGAILEVMETNTVLRAHNAQSTAEKASA
jgi:hypothetical protein